MPVDGSVPAAGLPRGGLVLASSSPYRRELLGRLGLPFASAAPRTDEHARSGETPERLVVRLAEEKARDVGARHAQALVIGSDQLAVLDDEVLGKPGTPERARAQLRRASGKTVTFVTGLCLLDTRDGTSQVAVERYAVVFRTLDDARIARYIDAERPFDCAGSFKSEGLGIALFERLAGDDPATLIGLPLIRLVSMLAKVGVELP